ncbi:MAG TPA: extracellular solute-binding protein [Candidatus Binatia bacterium]
MVAKIGVFIALLSLFPFKTVAAAEEPPNLADAKKEGKVVLYVSAQLPLAQTISRAFEKKYPFLKVEITRTSGENLLNRIKTEKLAGKMAFDVVYGATVPLMPTLGVVKPYLSAEAKAYPAKFREPKDFWVGVSANYYVIGYNTKLVAKNEAPRDWKDLLQARWKGRFAMDPEEFSWFGAMETYLGEEEANKLMTGLARQDIQWRKNHTTLAQFLAAGEYPAALVYAHSIEEMKGKGAPIDWVRTTAPIVLDIQAVALSAQPLHPNAGKLFVDFLLSSEAQTIIYQDRKIPIMPGVVPESSALHPTGLELFPSPPKVVTNLNHYASKFEQIFGPRR